MLKEVCEELLERRRKSEGKIGVNVVNKAGCVKVLKKIRSRENVDRNSLTSPLPFLLPPSPSHLPSLAVDSTSSN